MSTPSIHNALEIAKDAFLEHPRTTLLTLAASFTIKWCITNYISFYNLGESGLGRGPVSWFISTGIRPLGRETLSTEEYDRDPVKDSYINDAGSIKERRGARPRTGWHFFPHRQVDRRPSKDMEERLDAIFFKIAKSNADVVEVVPSPHERVVDAMVIHSSVPSPHAAADRNLREIAHVHDVDHSVHLVCAPQDCKLIIERGWGERHPMSGRARMVPLPKEFLLVYAPRDEEELEVVKRFMLASVGFMTGSRDLKY